MRLSFFSKNMPCPMVLPMVNTYLHKALYLARNRYKSLGLQIGVNMGEIVSIESKYTDPGERLLVVLSVRVNKTETLTWNDIDAALRLDCVGERKTADSLRKKYGHLFRFSSHLSHYLNFALVLLSFQFAEIHLLHVYLFLFFSFFLRSSLSHASQAPGLRHLQG